MSTPVPTELQQLLPVLMVLASLLPGIFIFGLREGQRRARTVLNLSGAVVKVGLIALLVPPVVDGLRPEWRSTLLPGVDLVLRMEPFSLLFAGLSSLLWLVTTIYAIGYLEDAPHRNRFFGFFSLCVTSTAGIAVSGNLITFLLFYELLTLATYPLVAHRGTPEAMRAARIYLWYTLSAGIVLLLAVAWLTWLVGPVDFTEGGAQQVAQLAAEQPVVASIVCTLLLAGLGVKAALFPLHGWLPIAMIAPAPVSALLHAVAVVKAGVFGIVRVVHYVFGVETVDGLGVLTPLAVLAAATIVYGSVKALREDDLKRRLAYSTVSQLAYITLGAAIVGMGATAGSMVHLVHQGLMKITLFFCAGVFAETLSLHKVSELGGVGRRMPLTALAFTVGALGMIGVPPVAGFVSKWQIGTGAAEADQPWVVAVLALSTVLNAAYFLPILYLLWVHTLQEGAEWTVITRRRRRVVEAPLPLLVPTVLVAGFSLVTGLMAGVPYSPLSMSQFIAELMYP